MELGGNVEVETSHEPILPPHLREQEVRATVPGIRIFSVSLNSEAEEVDRPAATDVPTTLIYHKIFPGLKTPFGLPIECFPQYEKMLDKKPHLVEAVNVMLQGAVSESTNTQYGAVVREFYQFCQAEKLDFPNFSDATVLEFVAVSFANGRPLGLFRTLLAALAMVEKVTGRSSTVLSDHVRSAVYSVQRHYEQNKPAVKKAKKLDYLVVNHLIELEVLPHVRRPHNIEAVHFRSLFRATIIYFTMCRFADFAKLTDREFQDGGDHIKITFLTRKNDQHGDNSLHIIPQRSDCAVCPVKLIRLYFWRFGLRFQGTGKSVNFRIGRQAGVVAAGKGSLSRCNAQRYFKQLLSKHGYIEEAENYSEKCLKVGSVTNTLDAGEPLENVKVVGGWKSLTTPLHYRELSERFRRDIAARIPLGPPRADTVGRPMGARTASAPTREAPATGTSTTPAAGGSAAAHRQH
jgi:hypothetical protein